MCVVLCLPFDSHTLLLLLIQFLLDLFILHYRHDREVFFLQTEASLFPTLPPTSVPSLQPVSFHL